MRKFVRDMIGITIPFVYLAGFFFNAVFINMVDNHIPSGQPEFKLFLMFLGVCFFGCLVAFTHIGLRRLDKYLSQND